MKEKFHNGKPLSHWQKMADELVIDSLLRAATNLDTKSLPGKLASKRLMEIAKAENPRLLKEAKEKVAVFQAYVNEVLSEVFGWRQRNVNR